MSDYGDDLSAVDQLSAVSFGSDRPLHGGGGGGGGGGSGDKMEAELLRMDLRRAEAELQTLHTQSSSTIRELQARCAAAEQRAQTAESSRDREEARHEAELARAGQKHAQEMAETLRSRKKEFDADEALAREKSAALRSSFTPLELSAERYADLKGTASDDLPFREWLQVQVHETVSAATKALETARRERDQLRVELNESRETEGQAKREAAQAVGALQAREQVMSKAAAAADEEKAALRREAAAATARVEQVAAEEATFATTKSRLAALEGETGGLRKERDDAVSKYEALTATATNAVALQQQLDLLKMDKMYLTRELDTLKQRLYAHTSHPSPAVPASCIRVCAERTVWHRHRAEETADAAAPQVEELKTQKQQLYDKVSRAPSRFCHCSR